MRITSRLLATTAGRSNVAGTIGGTGAGNILSRPAPLALLPPIPLYRRLLRAHRKHLATEMRLLGDEYVKSEFRAHRDIENPAHLIGFLTEWQLYAQKIEGDSWIGEKLDPAKVEKMSDQQIGQMYELMMAIKNKEDPTDGTP